MIKQTEYRVKYSDGKLNKKCKECDSAIELWMLWLDWKRVAHEESRTFRLINADTVIKDINTFIRHYKKAMQNTTDMTEMALLLTGLSAIEKEKIKKNNKRKGGFKAQETKEEVAKEEVSEEKVSDWIEIMYSPFSVNYMYNYRFGKKVRSNSYEKWIMNFPRRSVPTVWDFAMTWGIRVNKKIALDIEVITTEGMDVDNCIKSFQDILFNNCWRINDDNNVNEINIKRVGVVDNYRDCKIRFRVRQ